MPLLHGRGVGPDKLGELGHLTALDHKRAVDYFFQELRGRFVINNPRLGRVCRSRANVSA